MEKTSGFQKNVFLCRLYQSVQHMSKQEIF